MNRRFSRILETALGTGRAELCLWFLVHISVPLLLLLSIIIAGPVRINASLFDMLPKSSKSRAVMEADAIFGERNGREMIILVSAPGFTDAKEGAALLYSLLEKQRGLDNLSLYFDSGQAAGLYRHIYDYRFVIAGKETLDLLENSGESEIAQDALAAAFGAFSLFPLDDLERDPFLLTHRRMTDLLASPLTGGAMQPRDGVLAAEKDGAWYVLFRVTMEPGAVSLGSRGAVAAVYAAADYCRAEIPGIEFYFSGVPFHSYESSSGAQREISFISTITLLIILLLFLYVFRSPLPVVSSIAAVCISLGLGTAAALLVFREIHIITFVFGTTLIGTCVDYSVHFFIHWKGNPELESGVQIRRRIAKSVTMSFLSTEICFFVFLFAPFPILRQFAVFSMAGLFSSFMTCFCVYPRLRLPLRRGLQIKINWRLSARAASAAFALLVIAAIAVIALNRSHVKIKNDLSSLYTMSPALMEGQMKTAGILDYGSPGWYFIVSGESVEETLRNEEELLARLQERANADAQSFLATSVFVPPVERQERTYRAMKNLLPLAEEQFRYFGFSPSEAKEAAGAFADEFAASGGYCLPDSAPEFSSLWIGESGGLYYSAVMPIRDADARACRDAAAGLGYAHFVNKQEDIGRDLDVLTVTILVFFAAACAVISILVLLAYRRDCLRIYAVPLAVVLSALAATAAAGIPTGFFTAAALALVFGLGLDYIFYMTGSRAERSGLTLLGVILSFLTTLLSFGALAFSRFAPAHIFGLTVCAALSAAFITAVILQPPRED